MSSAHAIAASVGPGAGLVGRPAAIAWALLMLVTALLGRLIVRRGPSPERRR